MNILIIKHYFYYIDDINFTEYIDFYNYFMDNNIKTYLLKNLDSGLYCKVVNLNKFGITISKKNR
jgi:hypothetical protein